MRTNANPRKYNKKTNRPYKNRVNYMPYEEAKRYIHGVQDEIGSEFTRKKYYSWYKVNKPAFLPREPCNVYDEWESWNDFLGNDHLRFQPAMKKVYVPYWDAVRWGQQTAKKHKINTMAGWKEWANKNSDKIPDNIPKRPDYHYKEFFPNGGWRIFIGKNIRETIQTQQDHNLALMALCTIGSEPKNVFEVVIAKDGLIQLKGMLESRGNLRAVEVYHYESDLSDSIFRILEMTAKSRGDNVWVSPNVSDLLFEMSSILLLYRPKKGDHS